MAEFPNIGEHCTVRICQRLDYTPFKCDFCSNFYCGEHRFSHPCKDSKGALEQSKNNGEGRASTSQNSSFKKSYLCSFGECQNCEFIKFDCSFCYRNYCSKHRQSEDHKCEILEAQKSALIPPPKVEIRVAANSTSTLTGIYASKPKILDPIQQKRAERIEMIRLKSKNLFKVEPTEQIFLFLTIVELKNGKSVDELLKPESNHQPHSIVVSKLWTISKMLDVLKKNLNLEIFKAKNEQVEKSIEEFTLQIF